MNCGCDNRRDIMFTQGSGYAPIMILFALAVAIVYITV